MDTTCDPHDKLTALVKLAVASDDPAQLVAAAGAALGRPVGLVSPDGVLLGSTPDDGRGRRALAVAAAAARNGAVAPPGWWVFSLVRQADHLGFLAVGAAGPSDPETRSALRLLPALLADQLRRATFVRLHAAAFVRRLVTDPPLTTHHARREAVELGLTLHDAYWPALLTWHAQTVRPEALDRLEHEVRGLAQDSLTAPLNGHLVLLHPSPGEAGRDAAGWFEEVALLARRLAPSSQAKVIAAEHAVEPGRLSARVGHLDQLCRFGPRAQGGLVTSAPQYALDELLQCRIEPAVAARFVEDQIGRLLRWDSEHRTDLTRALEASMDFPRHEQAAHVCFMHRNTFRHHLSQAVEVLGRSVDDPDVRLAVHVALKLRPPTGCPPGSDTRFRDSVAEKS